jgi:hypothetical protein
MNNVSYALAYNFAPGKNDDGVTLTAPQALLNQVSARRNRCPFGREDRATGSRYRKNCAAIVPVPEFAAVLHGGSLICLAAGAGALYPRSEAD